MGLTSCRWITTATTLARRRRVAQPASCRLPIAVERAADRYTLICDGPAIPPVAMPRTTHDPREVPIPRSELRVVLTVAVAEEPARWASVGVLCGFLIRLPLLRPLELRRAA